MAVTASGLYLLNWIDLLDATQLAIDLSLTTNKVAMYTNSITPNFSTDTGQGAAPYNANQVAGTGYTAGGLAVGSPTITESPAGSLMFDLADSVWSNSTITNARCSLLHADALAGKNCICLTNFGSDYSTVAGTFTIQWAGTGMFAIDLTPP